MTLQELAEALEAELLGDSGDELVRGFASIEEATEGCIVFARDERSLARAERTAALAIIAPCNLRATDKPLLRVANPRLAFAKGLALFYPPERPRPGLDPTAQVSEGVELGEGVTVGPHVVLGSNSRIGKGAHLHAFVSVGRNVTVGEHCIIYPHVTLYDGVRLGARVTIQAGAVIGSAGFGYEWDGNRHFPLLHIGGVVLGDDVEIGANTTIDRGTIGDTVIGEGTKIDNLVQIAHNVRIGKHCLLAGQVGLSGSVWLGDRVILAGQVGVKDRVKMGDDSVAAGGAAIIRDVAPGEVLVGRPARPFPKQMRIDAAAGELPEMARELRRLRKRLDEIEKSGGR